MACPLARILRSPPSRAPPHLSADRIRFLKPRKLSGLWFLGITSLQELKFWRASLNCAPGGLSKGDKKAKKSTAPPQIAGTDVRVADRFLSNEWQPAEKGPTFLIGENRTARRLIGDE